MRTELFIARKNAGYKTQKEFAEAVTCEGLVTLSKDQYSRIENNAASKVDVVVAYAIANKLGIEHPGKFFLPQCRKKYENTISSPDQGPAA